MNVSNGTPGQSNNGASGFNPQGNPNIQRPQQNMGNNQQPNLSKNTNPGQTQAQNQNMSTGQMNYQQNQQMGYQQNYSQNQQMNYGQQQGYYQQQNVGQMNYGQQQMNYGQPVYPVMPAKSTIGLIGLILSILSLICCGPVLAIPGLICSIIAIVKNRGEKRAIVGTIIAAISIILWIILFATGVVSLNSLKFTGVDGVEHDVLNEQDSNNDYDYNYSNNTESNGTDYTYNDTEGNDTESNTESNQPVGNTGNDVAGDFDPSTIVYNGIKLEVGTVTATALEGILGYEFDESDMQYVVNPDYYTYTTYYISKDPYYRIVYFYFYNDTDTAIPMSDCKLYRTDVYASDYFSDDNLAAWANVDLGSGLNQASTIDDVKAVLGEPDVEYDNTEEYGTYEIKYYKQFDYAYVADFSFKDGALYEVSVGIY